jgi:hypothetical protein
MRNKTGGAVHTKTRFGSMVRRKVSPVQPRSNFQMAVRATLSALAKVWSDSTMDANRDAWIALANNTPTKDVFGQSQRLTGMQFFVKLNAALAAIGLATVKPAPATLVVGYPGSLTLSAVAGTHTLELTYSQDPAATEVPVIFAAAPLSRGVQNPGSRYRQIAYLGAGHPTGWSDTTHYYGKFGAWAVGKKICLKVLYTSNVTGAQGFPSTISCIST